MIKEIAAFILQQNAAITYWVRDVNYFVGHIPILNINNVKVEGISRIAGILENSPGDPVGDLPDRLDKPIQIYNRAGSYFQARRDAKNFYDSLHGSSQWELPSITSGETYWAMIIDAMGSFAPIENPDSKGRFVFSANYLFRIAE